MEQDERFEPIITVTKNACKLENNPNFQTEDDVQKTYEFFKSKNMNVEFGYKNNKFIPFSNFNPDIIIYSHPWYVETSQGPVICSKFAITCYIPYYFPTTATEIDYNLRFHQYIERYYIFDEISEKYYKEKMKNKGKNLKVTGQPFLDYFRLNMSSKKEYIIYAPHWTVANQGIKYATFEWNGEFLLDYAKKHPEQKWVFKPHPLLFKSLINNKIMSEDDVKKYYNDWAKIGLVYEDGDYLDIFNQSKMLITDCSSFLGEYFMTENPIIHLISKNAEPYNDTIKQIIKNYYKATELEELQNLLNKLPNNDCMKDVRQKALKELGYKNNYAALNVINDIMEQIENNEYCIFN